MDWGPPSDSTWWFLKSWREKRKEPSENSFTVHSNSLHSLNLHRLWKAIRSFLTIVNWLTAFLHQFGKDFLFPRLFWEDHFGKYFNKQSGGNENWIALWLCTFSRQHHLCLPLPLDVHCLWILQWSTEYVALPYFNFFPSIVAIFPQYFITFHEPLLVTLLIKKTTTIQIAFHSA